MKNKPKPRQLPKRQEEMDPTVDLRMQLDPACLSWELFLFGTVEPRKISELIQHMLLLDSTDEKRTINLLICSPGGECSAGYALIDIMTSLRHPVRTIALGEVCSMGSLIFIAGTPGERFIGSRALCLFHPLSEGMQDYAGFIKDRVKSLNISEGFADGLMKSRTSMPANLIEKANNGEVWFDAGEAIKYKVADKIITDNDTIAQMYAEIVNQKKRLASKARPVKTRARKA